ncbi:MAG: hypothetical protein CBC48_21125 [bacterium TMED88]|nr:hypothetical protein [Deltaproteobacteria bacterium]OUV20479.1 MAG: hypothetical protein CBC48_21125 [bacterium TMED88]
MKKLLGFKRTKSRLAFSKKEQAITALSIALEYYGYDITPAALKGGNSIDILTFESLLKIAKNIGFAGDYTILADWLDQAKPHDVSLINAYNIGTVVLQKDNKNTLILNNPVKQEQRVDIKSFVEQYSECQCLTLSNPNGLKKADRIRMIGLVLADKRFVSVAAVLLILSLLHGLIALIDPVIKNVYFSNVVQFGITGWAQSLAIGYIIIAVFSGILLLSGGLIGYLLTSRLALLWSYSVFSALLRMPDSYMELRTRGDMLNRVRTSEALASFFGTEEMMLIGSILNSFVLLFVLASTSIPMAIIYLLFTIASLLYIFTTNKGWKLRADQLQQDQAIEVGSFVRLMSSVKSLQYSHRANEGFRIHQLLIGNRLSSQQKMSLYSIYVNFGSTIIDVVQSVSLLTFAALLIMSGNISLGEYVGFSAIVSQLIAPTKKLTSFVSKYQSMNAIFDRIIDVVDESRVQAKRGIQYKNSNNTILTIAIKNADQTLKDSTSLVQVDEASQHLELEFSSLRSLQDWESYLNGDTWLPHSISVEISCIQSKKMALLSSPSPHLFSGTLIQNINIGNDPPDYSSSPLVLDLYNDFGFDDFSLSQNVGIVNNIENGLLALSIARALHQQPRALLVSITNANEAKLIPILVESALVKEKKIKIVVLKSKTVGIELFANSLSMREFEISADSSKQLISINSGI